MSNNTQLVNDETQISSTTIALMINQLQVLYFILWFGRTLVESYYIWSVLIIGIITNYMIRLIGKWHESKVEEMKDEKFFLYSSKPKKYILIIALFYLMSKIIFFFLNYIQYMAQIILGAFTIHIFIVTTIVYGLSVYLAKQGIIRTMRFILPVFLSTFVLIFIIFYFLIAPEFIIQKWYPIFPYQVDSKFIVQLVETITIFQVPILIFFLFPYVPISDKTYKIIRWGNRVNMLEYMLIILATMMYFGRQFAGLTNYPFLVLIRYIQLPFLERVDIFIVALYLILIVYILAFLTLFINRTLKSLFYASSNKEFSLYLTAFFIWLFILTTTKWFWKPHAFKLMWLYLEIGLSVFAYLTVFIYLIYNLKRGKRNETKSSNN